MDLGQPNLPLFIPPTVLSPISLDQIYGSPNAPGLGSKDFISLTKGVIVVKSYGHLLAFRKVKVDDKLA